MYTNGNYWIFYVAIFKGKNMKAYLDLLQYILENGEEKSDRTNTGTISSFGHQFEFDLEKGFPAVTTKSLAWKGVVSELLWFLDCLLYTSPSPRDATLSRMPSSA